MYVIFVFIHLAVFIHPGIVSCSVGLGTGLVCHLHSCIFLEVSFTCEGGWFVTCVEFVLWRLRHEERLRCDDLPLHRWRFRARACLKWKHARNTEKAVTKLIHTISDNEEAPWGTQISGGDLQVAFPSLRPQTTLLCQTLKDRWKVPPYISNPTHPNSTSAYHRVTWDSQRKIEVFLSLSFFLVFFPRAWPTLLACQTLHSDQGGVAWFRHEITIDVPTGVRLSGKMVLKRLKLQRGDDSKFS